MTLPPALRNMSLNKRLKYLKKSLPPKQTILNIYLIHNNNNNNNNNINKLIKKLLNILNINLSKLNEYIPIPHYCPGGRDAAACNNLRYNPNNPNNPYNNPYDSSDNRYDNPCDSVHNN